MLTKKSRRGGPFGDALSGQDYLTHAPILELIRRLRNGVAHNNKFTFKIAGRGAPGLKQLKQYPANNAQARIKTADFVIHASLEGKPVLFDFMYAADILDLLMSVEIYLTHITKLEPHESRPPSSRLQAVFRYHHRLGTRQDVCIGKLLHLYNAFFVPFREQQI